MIISSPEDFREAAKRKLPRFLFDYIDGGSYNEDTLTRNVADFSTISLRQRVLKGTSQVDLSTTLFGETLALPIVLAPVGLTGMYARRGEVQAAKSAKTAGIPFTLSTVSVCPISEVSRAVSDAFWFQLYVLKDRAFMKHALEQAIAAGVKTLVFTVDMPTPGARYRDPHAGMSGPNAGLRRMWQTATHLGWAMDVGLFGHPHDLGNISAYRGNRTGLSDYIGWIDENFDPAIGWSELEWIRDFWPGKLIIKGVLDPADVEDVIRLGADGLVVSNHGGRQLDGAPSAIRALPGIHQKVDGRISILMDSGIRNGLDVVRAICLGADAVMIGRSYAYALAAAGQSGVETLLGLYKREMEVAMTLTGAHRISDLTSERLSDL